jgi:phosphohistidine phosphatase
MRTLLLLRHAKARTEDAGGDAARPLAPRGLRAAERVGEHLAERGLVPDLVLCSTALRARQTWERAAAALRPAPRVELDGSLYLAAPARILARVQEVGPAIATLLVVGHNPGFHELAYELAESSAARDRLGKFPTAALARFELADGSWSAAAPGLLRFVELVAPRDLDDV